MASLDFHADQRQQQTLSPRLQHAVRLLQLSSLDFAQEVSLALGRNPFLESEDHGDESDLVVSPVAEPEVTGAGESDREVWHADALARQRRADSDLSALELMPQKASLAQHLHAQLTAQALPQRDRLLAQVVIESLDGDGYLRTPLEDLLSLAGLSPPPASAEMALALQRVQSLEPAGVGARSVAECLRLQLPSIECPRMRELAEVIIDEHLERLAARDVHALARALGEAPAAIEAACDRIRHFDPRPGWRHDSGDIHYVVPDVIVRKVRGAWTVQLNPAVVPRIKLNQVYADLFQRCRRERQRQPALGAEPHDDLANHLQEARWTVRNVEQRFSTILEVAQAIVRRQKHFFEFGPMAMRPLGLREIAEELGMHESTVSRVTNNKYMAAPQGVIELKRFFSRAMVTASGNACSGTAIRGLIQDMIDGEAADAPLSDAEIARQLARQGLRVARRTVTKYRQLLRIESVERRKRLA
jgi:RNA polymerase sigma-54 factor